MRICIITMFTKSMQEAGEIALVNKKEYASLHGYAIESSEENLNPTRCANSSKISLLKKVLPNYDWIFWIDADAMIMNYGIKLETLIDEDYDIIITKDEFAINNGVFLLRNSAASIHMLEEVSKLSEFESHYWTDNAAMIRCLEPESALWEEEKYGEQVQNLYDKRMNWHKKKRFFFKKKIVPQRMFNSYSGHCERQVIWSPGDFVCHAAGWQHWAGVQGMPDLAEVHRDLQAKSNYQIYSRDEFGDLFNILGYTGNGAEIGVQEGAFANAIRSKWKGHLFLIDCWEYQYEGYIDSANYGAHENFYEKVKSLFSNDEKTEIIKAYSPQAANDFPDGFFDWVYIDANHSYEACLADIRGWYSKVRRGGMLCGHDFVDGDFFYGKFGVKSAVNKFCAEIDVNLMVTKDPYNPSYPYHPSWYFIKTK